MTKIVCISDTHTYLDRVSVPSGDILVHSGDATFDGTGPQIAQFNQHLEKHVDRFKHIIYVPGNHDFGFQDSEKIARKIMTNAIVLIDEAIEVEGIKFYGSPWQPWFRDWAFNFPERELGSHETATKTWAKIPNDTKVLLTHTPPYMMMDKTSETSRKNNNDRHVGCKSLAEKIKELLDLKLHVFGHIHECYGEVKTSKVHFVNASICTRLGYNPTNAPIVVEI